MQTQCYLESYNFVIEIAIVTNQNHTNATLSEHRFSFRLFSKKYDVVFIPIQIRSHKFLIFLLLN